jgi:hypothetical protein
MARRTVTGEDQWAHLATMDEIRRYHDRFWDASLTRFKEQAERVVERAWVATSITPPDPG